MKSDGSSSNALVSRDMKPITSVGSSSNALESLKAISNRHADEKVVLEWADVQYSLMVKNEKRSKFMNPAYMERKILKGVSGSVISGQLLAIMGPTGCGKTSLLNVLSSRVSSVGSKFASLQGEIKVNGKLRNDEEFRRVSAYVIQDDLLYPHLTVEETLILSAKFFLPLTLPTDKKTSIVQDIMAELSLMKARDTIIGDEKTRGVSGGERKRAAIATQLITDPAVLFLDEPTSGLDAFQALSVMECMKTMAHNGRLVISVIHQPRSSIFSMFDRLLLLSEGHTIYSGIASQAAGYFNNLGHSNPSLFNPADFFLDILSPDNRSEERDAESQQRIETLAMQWKKHMAIHQEKLPVINSEIKPIGNPGSVHKTLFNFTLLCWRSFTESRRDLFTIKIKLFTSILFGLIFGGIYSETGDGQSAVQNITGFFFIVCLNQAFGGLSAVLNTFPKEKLIMNREYIGGAYEISSYFLAKFFTEIPINMLSPVVLCCISYFTVGLDPDPEKFFIFLLMICYLALTGVALGLAVGAAVPNVDAAQATGPPIIIIMVLFGGYYINLATIPAVANWLPYVSIIKW
eukprot:CAMPEP_0182437988 /NCGR_PEP_ID=MMETSP1167-20130531/85430_1 /TAXON_ID=2988 /ORGANISM="Mallomonas Sp, Strain CCMP3275" /LENGTH=574 /DNA_ID=CAMNT_0024631123 /DNA_START=83 /DNA_END=1804 /DNA_ORIENTATION=+